MMRSLCISSLMMVFLVSTTGHAFSIRSKLSLNELSAVRSRIRPAVTQQQERNGPLESTQSNSDNMERLTITLPTSESSLVIDLELNRALTADQPDAEIPLSHYAGSVRGINGSSAAISTYDGLRGLIFVGQDAYTVEPVHSSSLLTDDHILVKYRNADIQFPLAVDRAQKTIDRYVELLVTVDNSLYKSLSSSLSNVKNRLRDMYNIVNMLYKPLGVAVNIKKFTVWRYGDKINVGPDPNINFNAFRDYRKIAYKSIKTDSTHFITGKFQKGIAGLASGALCTEDSMVLIVNDRPGDHIFVALVIAHEMGHSLGLPHDDSDPSRKCTCPKGQGNCIEGGADGYDPSKWGWSDCNVKDLNKFLRIDNRYPCLVNKPCHQDLPLKSQK